MAIEIGKIRLAKIHKLETLEKGSFIYQEVPGMNGNVIQELGRPSVRLLVQGIFYGEKAGEELDKLRQLFLKREPQDFIADITGQAYAGKVIIDSFDVQEESAYPMQYSYSLVVSEYIEPPRTGAGAGTSPLENVNNLAKLEAAALMDLASLPDALSLGAIPELSNPFEPLKGSLEPLAEASSGFVKSMSSILKLFE